MTVPNTVYVIGLTSIFWYKRLSCRVRKTLQAPDKIFVPPQDQSELRCMGTLPCFSTIFSKEDNLFDFLYDELFQNGAYFPLRVAPF